MSARRHTRAYFLTNNKILSAVERLTEQNIPSKCWFDTKSVYTEADLSWGAFRCHFKSVSGIFIQAEETLVDIAHETTNALGRDIRDTQLNVFFIRLFMEFKKESVFMCCRIIARGNRNESWVAMIDELRPILSRIWPNYNEKLNAEIYNSFCYSFIGLMNFWILRENFDSDLLEMKAKMAMNLVLTIRNNYLNLLP